MARVIDRKEKPIDTFHMGVTACFRCRQNTCLDFVGKVNCGSIQIPCSQNSLIGVYLCVCVCVCVERERERTDRYHSNYRLLNVGYNSHWMCFCILLVVVSIG